MESRPIRYGVTAFTALLLAFGGSTCSQAQGPAHDPGVRDPRGAHGALPGLSADLQNLFDVGQKAFGEPEAIDDGLGPRMNLDSCRGCHAQPASGGSSPKVNPQFVLLNGLVRAGGNKVNQDTNKLPSFITKNGPTREARFKQIRENGGPDGGVHDLFTIAGMTTDTAGCKIKQPEFEEELRHNNVIFRIPTPVFGAGLIEQIPDQAIIDNINKDAYEKTRLKIYSKLNIVMSGGTITKQKNIEKGKPNKNGNDGTIARFGWKAQNKSLLIFSGEAYNVEMGISNELFQTERDEDPNCQFKATPNDTTNPKKTGLDVLSDTEKFASFMRLLAPPEPSNDVKGASPVSIAKGESLFRQTGCALCHTPMLMTGESTIPQLSKKPVKLYSDLAVHHMGAKLDDGVEQGQAAHDQFRTAPLWGLGERIWFLHDGRTSDLAEAIEFHHSTISFRCRFMWFFFQCGPDDVTDESEANAVVEQYDNLSERDKQDLLNFLRSL